MYFISKTDCSSSIKVASPYRKIGWEEEEEKPQIFFCVCVLTVLIVKPSETKREK